MRVGGFTDDGFAAISSPDVLGHVAMAATCTGGAADRRRVAQPAIYRRRRFIAACGGLFSYSFAAEALMQELCARASGFSMTSFQREVSRLSIRRRLCRQQPRFGRRSRRFRYADGRDCHATTRLAAQSALLHAAHLCRRISSSASRWPAG